GAAQVLDVNPQDSFGRAVGTPEREAGRGLGRDHVGQDAAVVGRQVVAEELRFDLAVGVKDVDQDGLGSLVADGSQVSADLRADAFQLMASGAYFLEKLLAAGPVTRKLQRFLVGGDHVLATTQLRRGEELGGASTQDRVGLCL